MPEGASFVDSAATGGDLFFLRFADIFGMLNLHPLHHTFVRLFSLSMAMQIIREKIPGITIVDSYYMCESCLGNFGDRKVGTDYLKGFMLANKRKDYILVPFFPE